MNRTIKGAVLLAAWLVVAGTGPAALGQDTDPASQFSGFYCEIDLADPAIAGVPAAFRQSFLTADTDKLCTGSKSSENVKLDCRTLIEGWPGGTINDRTFVCRINGAPCDVGATTFDDGDPDTEPTDPDSILVANAQSLMIDRAGNAVLTCQFKR